jgi:hypothetical protein
VKIPSHPEYEADFIDGRADAVYGWLIIEYEAPQMRLMSECAHEPASPTAFQDGGGPLTRSYTQYT